MPVLKLRRPNGETQDIALTTNRSQCGTWALPVVFNGTQYWAKLHTNNNSAGKVRRPDGTVLTLQPYIATSGSYTTKDFNEKGYIRNLAPNTTYNFSINYGGNKIRSTQQITDGEGKIYYEIRLNVGEFDSSKTVYLGSYKNTVTGDTYYKTIISWTPA